ncbi:hypothetical protein [Roseimicrobium sp. ORNL1]|uniref:hypothetical protein n=1 Tax=Roseimicrobium sp. ORNL1 TaxID=2711231 RepID=UPI0013E1AC37|nr:hypothetical protein [Roseimicrobium sp. ORNL1]QIF02870.1 hypothetical protein G5S37_15525 [Roseimicrobium sp. ORNL1]
MAHASGTRGGGDDFGAMKPDQDPTLVEPGQRPEEPSCTPDSDGLQEFQKAVKSGGFTVFYDDREVYGGY